ncbi:MAG: c-type cytochrome [Desulfovibrionaceae bacterium]
MKRILIVFSLALFLATGFSAHAADAVKLYARCMGCHGGDGSKVQNGTVLKGMSEPQVIMALQGYRDGSYGGSKKGLMKNIAAKLTDADIKALGERIAKF